MIKIYKRGNKKLTLAYLFCFMAKDPAVLFYCSDFLTGTTGLTMEERGQYITLLCLQHQQGHLSEKTIRLAVGSASVDVLSKFKKDDNGNFFNERMEEEIEKRSNFVKIRQNNGKLGGRPKTEIKPTGKPKDNLQDNLQGNLPENENENTNEIEIKGKRYELKEIGDLPEIKIGAAKTFLKIAKGIDKTDEEIVALWEAFKAQNVTGNKFYNSISDIETHFLNWLQLKKINGHSNNSVGSSTSVRHTGAMQLVESLKRDYAAGRKQDS